MKKIMFNDRFGLTDAVLEGRKTVTRRIVTPQPDNIRCMNEKLVMSVAEYDIKDKQFTPEPSVCWLTHKNKYIAPHYKVGEVIAIAQKYQDIINYSHYNDKEIESISKSAGWSNKMFVLSYLMPNQIEILDVRAERLQDITDKDCIKEGISSYDTSGKNYIETVYGVDMINKFIELGRTPREAFASLIDKVSGKGTWESNPYVFRYEFKLK